MEITPKKLAIFKDKKAIGLLYLDAKGKPREFIFPVRDLSENSDVKQVVYSIRSRHRQKLAKVTDEQLKRLVARLMKLCYPHKKYDFDFPLDPPRASPSYPPPSNQQSTSASAASSLLSGSKPSSAAPAQTKPSTSSSIGNLVAQDLNKFDDANLAVAKKIMEVDFKKNQVKPGDPEYTYDVRKDFVSREESSWDVDEANDDDEPKHDTNALKPSGSSAPKSGFNMDEFRASLKTTATSSSSLGGTSLSGVTKDAGPTASNPIASSQVSAASTTSSSLLSSANPRPSFDFKTTKEEPAKLALLSTTKKEQVHNDDEYLDEDDDLDATPTSFKANQYSFNAKGGTGFSQFSGYKGSKSNPGSALTSATQSREYDDSFEESGDFVEGDEDGEGDEEEEITIPAPSKGSAFGSLGSFGSGNTHFGAKPSLTVSNTISASNVAKANPTNFSSMYNAGDDDEEEEGEGEGEEDEDYEDDEDSTTATSGPNKGFGMNRPGFGVKEFLSGSSNQGIGSLGKTPIGQSYGVGKVGGTSTGLGQSIAKGEFEDDEDEDDDEADTVPQRPSTGQFGAFGSGYKLGGGIGGSGSLGGTGTWATTTGKTVQHAVDGDEDEDDEFDEDGDEYYGKASPAVGYKPGNIGQQRQQQPQQQRGSAHADDAEDVDDEEFEHDGDEEEEEEGW